MERRQAHRFAISLPVTLDSWDGRTRDVSAEGIYCDFTEDTRHGRRSELPEQVKLRLLLEHVGSRPVEVLCDGEVMRVDQVPGRFGVAVKIMCYQLDESKETNGHFA